MDGVGRRYEGVDGGGGGGGTAQVQFRQRKPDDPGQKSDDPGASG